MQIRNGRVYGDDGVEIQARDVTGDIGTVIIGGNGPIHLGSGNMYTFTVAGAGEGATVVVGDEDGNGVTVIAGDNHGGISRTFGSSKKRK